MTLECRIARLGLRVVHHKETHWDLEIYYNVQHAINMPSHNDMLMGIHAVTGAIMGSPQGTSTGFPTPFPG